MFQSDYNCYKITTRLTSFKAHSSIVCHQTINNPVRAIGGSSGQYYKHFKLVNYDCRVVITKNCLYLHL